MRPTRMSELAVNRPLDLAPTPGVLVTHAVLQVGSQLVQHLLVEHQAEEEHRRRLESTAVAEQMRRADLDRLERLASNPEVPSDQRTAAGELLLDLIGRRHGQRPDATGSKG